MSDCQSADSRSDLRERITALCYDVSSTADRFLALFDDELSRRDADLRASNEQRERMANDLADVREQLDAAKAVIADHAARELVVRGGKSGIAGVVRNGEYVTAGEYIKALEAIALPDEAIEKFMDRKHGPVHINCTKPFCATCTQRSLETEAIRAARGTPKPLTAMEAPAKTATATCCWVMHHEATGDVCGQILLPGLQCGRRREEYIHQPCKSGDAFTP